LLIGFLGGIGVALAYVAYQAVVSMFSILLLILVSAFLAIGLNPAVMRLQQWGLRRGLAVAVVALSALAVVALVLVALIPPLITQGTELAKAFPEYLESLKRNRLIGNLNERFDLLDKIQAAGTGKNAASALGGVLGGLKTVASVIFAALTVMILTLYFLAAFDRLKRGAYRLVPASRRDRVQRLADEMLTRVGGYLAGAVVIAAIAGASSLVFMLIAGIPYALALALAVALFDLIPQVGATLGAVVVTIVAFFVSVPVGIASIAFFVAYQQLENWIIYPRVMRRSVNVSDLAGIISVLIGASLLGIVGALIAIPVCAAVQLIVREVVLPRQEQV